MEALVNLVVGKGHMPMPARHVFSDPWERGTLDSVTPWGVCGIVDGVRIRATAGPGIEAGR